MGHTKTMKDAHPVPAARGYRMPAEWEPHAATWLSWPRPGGISFPGHGAYDRAVIAMAKMVHALAGSEPVNINVCDTAHERKVQRILSANGVSTSHVTFHQIPINEPWCRDHGPIFVTRAETPRMLVLDWGYNSWGFKYPPFDDDDYVPTAVAARLNLPVEYPGMILEGGSIDVNGEGLLLTTRSCLLNPNRNPELKQCAIEHRLRDFLGVREVIWLGDGIEGDDTDGHVDDVARFIGAETIVCAYEEDESDSNFAPLRANYEYLYDLKTDPIGDEEIGGKGHKAKRIKNEDLPGRFEVIKLPMPRKIVRDGQRLPASYANFYIANKVVLLPVFADTNDRWAASILKKAFPGRRVVEIDCRELIWGLGAFHCLTQQQPA